MCRLFQKRKQILKMPSYSTLKCPWAEQFLNPDIFTGICTRSMDTLIMPLPWKREESNLKLVCVNQIMTSYKNVTSYQDCQRAWKQGSLEGSSTVSHHAYTNIFIFLQLFSSFLFLQLFSSSSNYFHTSSHMHTHLHTYIATFWWLQCTIKCPLFETVNFI